MRRRPFVTTSTVSARSDLIHVSMGISGAVLNDCGLSELITRNAGHHPKADRAFLRLSQRYLSRLSSTTGIFRQPYESSSALPLPGQFSLARRFIFTTIVTILSFWSLLPFQSYPFAGPELSICRSRAIHLPVQSYPSLTVFCFCFFVLFLVFAWRFIITTIGTLLSEYLCLSQS